MLLAKIVGTVVATRKDPRLVSSKLLVVRPIDLIAAEQIRAAEKQRLMGVIPNFYTSYIYDAAPLTPKQKFSLAARGTFDPASVIREFLSKRLTTNAPGYGRQ
jgi:hypothetical protein